MNKEILSGILNTFGIRTGREGGPISEHEGLARGNGSNIWYFKDLQGLEMVLKEYPYWVGKADILWIHEYMERLSQKGFPLAKTVAEPIQKEGHYFGIYEFANGLLFDKKNVLHVTSVAATLRKLHDFSRDIKIQGTRNWPTVYGYQPPSEQLVNFDYENGKAFLQVAWDTATSLLQGKEITAMPIHGDFRGDNMRFNQNGVSKVFDFGNSRNDFAEVDLAITLRDVADGSEVNQEAFLRVYKNSGIGEPKIDPEAICASGLILAIQECLYFWRESKKNPSIELENLLKTESSHLKAQLINIPQKVSTFKDVLFER